MNKMQVQVDYRGLAMTISVEADDHIDTSAENLARCAMGFLGAELGADEPELVATISTCPGLWAEYRRRMERYLAHLLVARANGSYQDRPEGEIAAMNHAVCSMGGYEGVTFDHAWCMKVLA